MTPRADDHAVYVLHLPYFGGYQTKCTCGGFESRPMPSRPEAIREHTIHAAPYLQQMGAWS